MTNGDAQETILIDGPELEVTPAEAGRRLLGWWQGRKAPEKPVKKETERGIPGTWGLVCQPQLEDLEGGQVWDSLQPLLKRRLGDVYPYHGELDLSAWLDRLDEEDALFPEPNMYLLLVGSAKAIPYDFQKMLTRQYYVGRLHLPNAAAYDRYVQTLLKYEQDEVSTHLRRRCMEFYAPDDTNATSISRRLLVEPLMDALDALQGQFEGTGWLGDQATREQITAQMKGYRQTGAPAVVFMASHGYNAGPNPELREKYQGSWEPQESPRLGPGAPDGDIRRYYLTGEDFFSGELSAHGSIVFNFACFGAGLHQEFTLGKWILADEVESDDPDPVVSALGQGLLGGPYPALAYVSTVDAKTNVFSLLRGGLVPFRKWMEDVLGGVAVGLACEEFWDAASALQYSAYQLLEAALQEYQKPEAMPEAQAQRLALQWFMGYELDGFVVQGDPAARLHRVHL
jgi:hypothetical protein